MKAQFITTPNGDELAIIPRAEYEDLLARAAITGESEDDEYIADRAIYDARKSELAAGGAALPHEVSLLMLRGASLPRALRKWKRLSQQEVAARIGTAQGFISDLESGRRRTAVNTVRTLAALYDVPETLLMDAIGPK